MVAPTPSSGYSAKVRLELHVGTRRWPLAQIAKDRLIFDEPVVLPGTQGEAFVFIDERQQQWIATWSESDVPRQIVSIILQEN
jgi:hypothetical protein